MLMMFNTPQTRENPAAMHAYSPPRISPLARICSHSTAGLFHAQPEISLCDGLRVDDDRLAALDLEHRRLERVDLASGAELDRSPEGGLVHLGELVAHLRAIERAGALDRHLKEG